MAVITYKCPNCEGPLKWDGGKKKFICEYCDSEYDEAEILKLNPDKAEGSEVYEDNSDSIADNAEKSDGVIDNTDEAVNASGGIKPQKIKANVKIYSCPSCGAQIAADETLAATECFYCGNPVVLSDKFAGSFDPDYVVPFEIDKKKASEIFRAWLKQHRYIPDAFYKDRIDEVKGVYFPYWVYSGKITSHVKGTGENIRIYRLGDTEFTKTSVYAIEQPGDIEINDISCIALKSANKILCESAAPFRLEKKKKFEPAYMQGYMAEIRDIEKSDIIPMIKAEAESYAGKCARSALAGTYDRISIESVALDYRSENYSYCMLPIWTLTYKDNDGKIYYFSINGQTGKTSGELPADNRKLLKLFLSVAVPVFIAVLLFFRFIL